MAYRVASYGKQNSSGFPLVDNGVIQLSAIQQLAYFDIVTVEATPWGKDTTGFARCDVISLLRHYNPNIKIFLYLLVGDQWLPPTFSPSPNDHSAFADIFNAVKLTEGWLWGMDNMQWLENYRVNLAKDWTISALINAYMPLIKTRLFDGVFLDDCHTSIAWTNGQGGRQLDYARAGFGSLAAMDAARLNNIQQLISNFKEVGGTDFKVALNGTGPKPEGLDIDFREGLGSLITVQQAIDWVSTPGTHWLMSDVYTLAQQQQQSLVLIDIASHGEDVILTCGPGRDTPQYHIPKE